MGHPRVSHSPALESAGVDSIRCLDITSWPGKTCLMQFDEGFAGGAIAPQPGATSIPTTSDRPIDQPTNRDVTGSK